MAHKSIYYTTVPKNETRINIGNIINLKNVLKGFDFIPINDHHAFIKKNLNIIISNGGITQLSLISKNDLSQDLTLLAKLAGKINLIIGIKEYSQKIVT